MKHSCKVRHSIAQSFTRQNIFVNLNCISISNIILFGFIVARAKGHNISALMNT